MLFNQLKKYSKSGAYPFHMPGHKRRLHSDTLPYEVDITEIDGFDNLHHPEGCIKEVEEKAAKLYHAKRAFLLVNGATCGILAAIEALTNRGDKVIVARNCHHSVHHAVELFGLNAEYYIPTPPCGERMYNMYGSVNPFMIDLLLNHHPDAKLVIITSPTYEGIVSDITLIAEICHRHHARLLVDEAHGAHFPFHKAFPKNAVECGADLSVVSLHKTMPSLTQTALLLTTDSSLVTPLQTALSIFQTSSPSYVLMGSIECCLEFAEKNPRAFDGYVNRLSRFEHTVRAMKRLKLLYRDREEKISNLTDYDIGKLVISTAGTNLTGEQLSNILRKKYQIEIEMSASNYIIAMTSVCDTNEGFERLSQALLEIDGKCECHDENSAPALLLDIPEKHFKPSESFQHIYKTVPLSEAEGKASMEDIFAYPPGIPIIITGEIISKEIVDLINRLDHSGVNIQSSRKGYPNNLLVSDL